MISLSSKDSVPVPRQPLVVERGARGPAVTQASFVRPLDDTHPTGDPHK